MKAVYASVLLGLVYSQTTEEPSTTALVCNNEAGTFVDNSAEFGSEQFVVDIWNNAFILPLIIDDESGTTACQAGDILGGTSLEYECSTDGTMITKTQYQGTTCSGAVLSSYSWTTGLSPTLDLAQLVGAGVIAYDVNGTALPVTAGSGNIFSFQCSGGYAAAELEMGVSCSSLVTVFGAIGAGCLGTDDAQGKLLVSCDEDGAYLTTFVEFLSDGAWTTSNTCENNAAIGNFVCDSYTAATGDACAFLLTSSTGVPINARVVSCSAITTTTEEPDSAHSMSLFIVIVTLIASLLFH